MIFENRHDAAMQLLPHLRALAKAPAVVLAIPRGAVPMGCFIAKGLHLPLDLLPVKKIGHPYNPELAIGSVSTEGRVIDRGYAVDDRYIEQETSSIRTKLQENYKKFMGTRKPVSLQHKTVIIVDDGIATGNTMLAAIDLVRHQSAQSIIIATPVASPEAVEKIQQQADRVVCLYTPQNFMGVGQFYYDFSEITDREVTDYLRGLNEDHLFARSAE